MMRGIGSAIFLGILTLSSCTKKEAGNAPTPGAEASAAVQPPGGPHAFIHLKDRSQVAGSIVASSQLDMVVAGDDGIERKIPMAQVQSVEYADTQPTRTAPRAARETTRPKPPIKARPVQQAEPVTEVDRSQPASATPAAPPPLHVPAVTAKTYVLPAGSEVSVRTDEAIDSGTAAEGQTFDAQVTRDVTDGSGAVVIPRGSKASIVIKSASKGGRFRGASDLVLDMQSLNVNGAQYTIETADITQKGKSGMGINKRTAEYTGGGAALGAIIGAIAGGGKGAAIGAGAGAGAGVLTQVLTKGGSIKVPAESVLTFQLDQPLQVTAIQ
jgi:hypothetical protein